MKNARKARVSAYQALDFEWVESGELHVEMD